MHICFVLPTNIFLWISIVEKLITSESFAEVLCDDLDLPTLTFIPGIVQAMQTQVKQHSFESDITLSEMTDQRVLIKVS